MADRSRLACWGVSGGKAGGNYRIILNPGTKKERELPALCDNVRVRKGDRIRVVTTGGGGWGNPLDRELERVRMDVMQGKVTREGARLGLWVWSSDRARNAPVDGKTTEALRKKLRKIRKHQFIDRGEYYEKVVSEGNKKKSTEEKSRGRP